MFDAILKSLLAAAALASFGASAEAATAHNSQAGAEGPNTHICEATPYFAAGGCLSAAVEDDRRYDFIVPATPARPGRRLVYPGARLPNPDE